MNDAAALCDGHAALNFCADTSQVTWRLLPGSVSHFSLGPSAARVAAAQRVLSPWRRTL
jgi:hypothetical protein